MLGALPHLDAAIAVGLEGTGTFISGTALDHVVTPAYTSESGYSGFAVSGPSDTAPIRAYTGIRLRNRAGDAAVLPVRANKPDLIEHLAVLNPALDGLRVPSDYAKRLATSTRALLEDSEAATDVALQVALLQTAGYIAGKEDGGTLRVGLDNFKWQDFMDEIQTQGVGVFLDLVRYGKLSGSGRPANGALNSHRDNFLRGGEVFLPPEDTAIAALSRAWTKLLKYLSDSDSLRISARNSEEMGEAVATRLSHEMAVAQHLGLKVTYMKSRHNVCTYTHAFYQGYYAARVDNLLLAGHEKAARILSANQDSIFTRAVLQGNLNYINEAIEAASGDNNIMRRADAAISLLRRIGHLDEADALQANKNTVYSKTFNRGNFYYVDIVLNELRAANNFVRQISLGVNELRRLKLHEMATTLENNGPSILSHVFSSGNFRYVTEVLDYLKIFDDIFAQAEQDLRSHFVPESEISAFTAKRGRFLTQSLYNGELTRAIEKEVNHLIAKHAPQS